MYTIFKIQYPLNGIQINRGENNMTKDFIGITMGDPAGVGPEIIVKALTHKSIYDTCKPVIIGDKSILEKAMTICGIHLDIRTINNPKDGFYQAGMLNLIDLNNIDLNTFEFGKVSAMCGKAAFEYIKTSCKLAMEGELLAIATAPINKESFKDANIPYIGHTEVLEDLTHSENPLTMFQVFDLRVFFLSRHVSLRNACDLVTKDNMIQFIKRSNDALRILGIENPRLAVAGLNPHSGEHGLFGHEEDDEIVPAVEFSRQEDINVVGPIGADSVFYLGLKGHFDAVLSLYHDQGHIATKMVDFEKTVSITNNLPFLRTSVDHGTAFDIAGTGQASEISLLEAVKLAAEYGVNYIQKRGS